MCIAAHESYHYFRATQPKPKQTTGIQADACADERSYRFTGKSPKRIRPQESYELYPRLMTETAEGCIIATGVLQIISPHLSRGGFSTMLDWDPQTGLVHYSHQDAEAER